MNLYLFLVIASYFVTVLSSTHDHASFAHEALEVDNASIASIPDEVILEHLAPYLLRDFKALNAPSAFHKPSSKLNFDSLRALRTVNKRLQRLVDEYLSVFFADPNIILEFVSADILPQLYVHAAKATLWAEKLSEERRLRFLNFVETSALCGDVRRQLRTFARQDYQLAEARPNLLHTTRLQRYGVVAFVALLAYWVENPILRVFALFLLSAVLPLLSNRFDES